MRQSAEWQLTWFRTRKNLEWIELKPDESLESVAYSFLRDMPKVCRSASASVT
jgi:tRNA A37 N6-isopentenylltransferase MiaA